MESPKRPSRPRYVSSALRYREHVSTAVIIFEMVSRREGLAAASRARIRTQVFRQHDTGTRVYASDTDLMSEGDK